jgi:hypothetical protein
MSYADFQQAFEISDYIIEHELHKKRFRGKGQIRWESKILLESLNCAMIIAYCRPFCAKERAAKATIPRLGTSILKVLSTREKEVHDVVMKDRNRVLAHSDSSGWNLEPHVLEVLNHKALIPLADDPKAPLNTKSTKLLRNMSSKLREAVFEKRMTLEKELIDHFPRVDLSGE